MVRSWRAASPDGGSFSAKPYTSYRGTTCVGAACVRLCSTLLLAPGVGWREDAPEPGTLVLCGIMRWIGTRGCDGGRPPAGCIRRLGTPCACSALRWRAIWPIWPGDILRRGDGNDTGEHGRNGMPDTRRLFKHGHTHPNICDMSRQESVS